MDSSLMMENQAKDALENIREFRRKGYKRNPLMEVDLVILWGTYRGWTVSHIAGVLEVGRSTVSRHRKVYDDHPHGLFYLPLIHHDLKLSKAVRTCLFCGHQMIGRVKKAREHVAAHVVPREHIKAFGVMEPR